MDNALKVSALALIYVMLFLMPRTLVKVDNIDRSLEAMSRSCGDK